MAAEKNVSIRAIAAIAGGGAVVALGWLSVTSGGHSASVALHSPPAPPTVTSPAMTLGATTTTGVRAPAAMATPKAHPNITGPAALPSEEAGLP
ncbi:MULTISPECIES: hypothetical protein [unclassified Mycolicibacterium]|uniref:hypothetical protein n=1 Tax=unclassified Mycolicibacterium TaxID=2636767 RepID=UPI0012DFBF30|nr:MULTISPECIES: hypothetical protein [unclassified Mycolicibacterium]MUM29491.1 hypothetical protein [Mycolicibacterium sp. CBMA 295]MUL81338.1 hypothetical protein [Mycolicibacterium sp. CBMA 329]MUL87104.1 hypothetical protein [Mycolicibacterium sp. CBMA 331]MUL98614.1 hypothetical protein [Mycolicibacterium sp. CBMA 334]MUM37401.1 hypothetical protein [Mycolicibacterium sp. CBMA 247]